MAQTCGKYKNLLKNTSIWRAFLVGWKEERLIAKTGKQKRERGVLGTDVGAWEEPQKKKINRRKHVRSRDGIGLSHVRRRCGEYYARKDPPSPWTPLSFYPLRNDLYCVESLQTTRFNRRDPSTAGVGAAPPPQSVSARSVNVLEILIFYLSRVVPIALNSFRNLWRIAPTIHTEA